MDTINPWLDPSEVRHLAEQLLRPVASSRINAIDPGFSESFEGFTTTKQPQYKEKQPSEPFQAVLPASAQSTNTAPHPAQNTPAPVPEPTPQPAPKEAEPEPLPQAPSKARFLQRIQIFHAWLHKNFKATEIFILDREGKVIFDESGHGRLHFMARNLASASKGSGNIHVKIGPASILEVLPCNTPYGRIVLGTLVPKALPPHHVQTITQVLIQTASPA